MPEFVHLHTHTEYSLLDGLSSPKALAERAAELGMKALAITDHGVMYGAVDFYKACKVAGIKAIIGMEAYVAPESRFSRDRNEGKAYHLILLAQNQQGYLNLLSLASLAQLEGFYYKPRIDKELLLQYGEGLIVLSACLQGEVPHLLLEGQEAQAREAARWYQEHFPGRFYLELQTHDIPEQKLANAQLIALAHEMGLPLVATNDIHYARKEQFEAHDVLLCIGTGKLVAEPKRMRMSDNSYYMHSPQEMAELYAHVPEALENTVRIAEQCDVQIAFAPPYHLPRFPVPEGFPDSESYLRHLCDRGMVLRYGKDATRPEYVERLEYELGIIHKMGFDDYFLIVWDLCRAAEQRDIWWNVRGSGAGSVVAYTLEVTNVEPFKNRLFFERFLNPDRISMPDIDLDYPDDRRDELIAYAAERYGADKVCGIITFGTLGARAAIRDVGRAQGIPIGDVDRVARLVPNVPGKPVSIAEALETIPELKDLYDSMPYMRQLLDTAQQLEGVARHASTHAAGVIVSDRPLTDYLPLNRPTKSDGEAYALDRVSQWPMDVVDAMGMLKVDFLGLRTLTHMRKTCELIEQEHGRKLNLNTIPYERVPDDPVKDADVKAAYDLLTSGETTGVFQVEGAGMRRTLQEMRPFQFQHIIAAIALYRPGPMDNIPTYIKRLHGEEAITYRHPILANILDDTFSVLIYQEQIMQIAVEMAGYKPGQADEIRKAVAKKKKDLMEKHQRMFREGAQARGIPGEIADAVWGDIEFFARYGFNRAHATDYAVITGQTAYLKAHYPLEFMTALMTTERNNVEKLGFLIADARRTGLTVLGPSLTHSEVEFIIEHLQDGERAIRIGLSAIKNVGEEAMRLIVEARKAGGPFKSLDDLANRVDLRKVNRRALECLIQAGALDEFGPRPALLAVLDTVLNSSGHTHEARDVGQFSLFGDSLGLTNAIQLPSHYPPISTRQILEWEKELLGVYLSEHPLAQQEREFLEHSLTNTTLERMDTEMPGQQLTVLGMVQRIRRITTKKGDMMAFVTLESPGGVAEVVVFPRTYERSRELLTEGRVVVVSGKLDARQDREDHPLMADWFKSPQDLLRPMDSGQMQSESPYLAREAPRPYAAAPKESSATSQQRQPAITQTAPALQEPPATITPVAEIIRQAPAPDISAIPEPPEEPPSPPATLCVTLRRSANSEVDYQLLQRLYQVMQAQEGGDNFVIYLQNDIGISPRLVELSFPNEHTCISHALRRQIEELIGAGNVRVVMAGTL
ncbi:MAG: DNA polymerase III subunit alpha [Anaerolineae bacterium]|nr:DNA polymerase III subunit alpha [Anaerolineae bacterium]